MIFRDKFLLSAGRPYGEDPTDWIAKVTEAGFRVSLDMQKAQMTLLKSGFEHVAQTQLDSSEALREELAYQADRLGRQIAQSSADIVDAVGQGAADTVESIQRMSDYLGAGLSEVRWAVERHGRISEETLKVLVESLSNESRQYFEQGFKCYETNEYDFAKKTFNKALEANITNHFAYQYLGIIAVAENNPTEAFRNFDLARKFSDGGYHRALALSHLARSHHAIDELDKAADLADNATQAYPELAKFWYELAGYSARLGRTQKAIGCLKEAIERDWMYFTVVAGDHDFDSVRTEVNELLDSLRERERKRARRTLDDLSRALDLFKKVGAANQIVDHAKTQLNCEVDYKKTNVFLYREISSRVTESIRSLLEIAAKKLIPEREKAVTDKKSVKRTKLSDLRNKLERLERESRELDRKKIMTGDTLGGFGCASAVVGILSLIPLAIDYHGSAVELAILISGGLFMLLWGFKYTFWKALPKWEVDRKIRAEAARIAPEERRIQDDFGKERALLKSEVGDVKLWADECSGKYVQK